MIVVWRLVKERQTTDAFTGKGARLYGGRWNYEGISVVYTGGNLSLSALEQFVHLGTEDIHLRFVYFRLEIPDNVRVEVVKSNALPPNWREEPAPDSTKDIGTRWVEASRSAVLRVPSIIVPVEYNYALNPHHPDFGLIRITDPKPFSFDPRMWKG